MPHGGATGGTGGATGTPESGLWSEPTIGDAAKYAAQDQKHCFINFSSKQGANKVAMFQSKPKGTNQCG